MQWRGKEGKREGKVPSASCLLNLSDAALDWPGVLECGMVGFGVCVWSYEERKSKMIDVCPREELQ
jgi:hypothetical protein